MGRARVTIRWHDKQYQNELRQELGRRVQAAGEMLRGKIVKNLSISTRTHGPSAPGESPHADMGKLRQSIFSDYDSASLTAIVGSPLKYARYLQDGTSNMEARPFLTIGAIEMQDRLKRHMYKGFKTKVTTGFWKILKV